MTETHLCAVFFETVLVKLEQNREGRVTGVIAKTSDGFIRINAGKADCSGGFFAHNYPEYIVGVAVGRTLTEGFLLGESLALHL